MDSKNRTSPAALERAEAHFKAREIQKSDAGKASAEYRAAQDSTIERTRRLRAERLAREKAAARKSA